MKAAIKKPTNQNTVAFIRNLFLSLALMVFVVATLYFLINSPA